MKTNQNLIRKMGGFAVTQRTKDGMFNASALLKQWNKDKSNPKRDLSKFWESSKINEFISELINDDILHTPKEGYVKSRASRGVNAGTWMHPFLFIKFSMWISPKFEVQVIKFVYDELIKYRHLAGDNYRTFCNAIFSIDQKVDFAEPAKWLNWIVFNNHKKEIRNKATQSQLQDLQSLEKKYSDLINEGYIKDMPTLRSKLRQEWRKQHGQVPLQLAS